MDNGNDILDSKILEYVMLVSESICKFRKNTSQFPKCVYLPFKPGNIAEVMGVKLVEKQVYDISGNLLEIGFEI